MEDKELKDYPEKEDIKQAQDLARRVSPMMLGLFEAKPKDDEKPETDAD